MTTAGRAVGETEIMEPVTKAPTETAAQMPPAAGGAGGEPGQTDIVGKGPVTKAAAKTLVQTTLVPKSSKRKRGDD